jgi:hypothetical protein
MTFQGPVTDACTAGLGDVSKLGGGDQSSALSPLVNLETAWRERSVLLSGDKKVTERR